VSGFAGRALFGCASPGLKSRPSGNDPSRKKEDSGQPPTGFFRV